MVCTVYSLSTNVTSGGHLSLLQLSLFINSANRVYRDSQLLAFADNMKIFIRINYSINDYVLLQNYFNRPMFWAKTLGLSFNVPEFHSVTFTRTKHPFKLPYFINNHSITYLNCLVCYLGFIFIPTLKCTWKMIAARRSKR